MAVWLAGFMGLTGCVWIDDSDVNARLDPDGDQIQWPDDCDDFDSAVGEILWFVDQDRDGFGEIGSEAIPSCEGLGEGFQTNDEDCDDDNPEVNPDMKELCDQGETDEDCDGLFDEEDPDLVGASEFYVDEDEDGWGDDTLPVVLSCEPQDHLSDKPGDCRDDVKAVNPDGVERPNFYDDDCDGSYNEGSVLFASDESGRLEIWMATSQLTDAFQLTYFADQHGEAGQPRASADGRWMAWVSEDEDTGDTNLVIYDLEADGIHHVRTVSGIDPFGLSWAPDGDTVQLLHTLEDKPALYSIALDQPTESIEQQSWGGVTTLRNVDVDPTGQELVCIMPTAGCASVALTVLDLGDRSSESTGITQSCDGAATRWHPRDRVLSLPRGGIGAHSISRVTLTGDSEQDSEQVLVTLNPDLALGRYGAPFSEDGGSVYATVREGDHDQIWIIDLSTGSATTILSHAAHNYLGPEVIRGL